MSQQLRTTEPQAATPPAEDPVLDLGAEEEPLHVLDLPQLHNQPSASILLSALADLATQPPTWSSTPQIDTSRSTPNEAIRPFHKRRRVNNEGVPAYLTRIIASSLAWIEDDEQKEEVIEAASQRLSERSGRSAMGSITRTFVVPIRPAEPENALQLTLHEPALTSDNLGLKTWASSYLLARRMCSLSEVFPQLPEGAMVLELGSGTGLVGLATAAICGAHVILTDLPPIVSNLETNASSNAATLATYSAKTSVAVLDWSRPSAFHIPGVHHGTSRTFPLIVVADPIYSSEHPGFLVNTIDYHVSRGYNARVVVEMPLREAYDVERNDFRTRMLTLGMIVLNEGKESGFDDWSSGKDEELSEVRCWWSIWGWP